MSESNLPKIPYVVLSQNEVISQGSMLTFFKDFGISNMSEAEAALERNAMYQPVPDTFTGLITVIMRNRNICVGRLGDFTWGPILNSRDGGSEIVLAKKANLFEQDKYNNAMARQTEAVMVPKFDKEHGTQLVLDKGNGRYILHDGPILITMECGKMDEPEYFLWFARYSLALEDALDRHRKS